MKRLYPWYDSNWLNSYVQAQEFIKRHYPARFHEFVDSFEPLRTSADFEVVQLGKILDEGSVGKIKEIIRDLQKEDLELHEIFRFGRFVIHDHPFLTQLQESLTDLVSDRVNEPVEPTYNFLSLYTKLGVQGSPGRAQSQMDPGHLYRTDPTLAHPDQPNGLLA